MEKRVINSLSDCSLLLHYGAETNTKHLSLKTAAHTNTHTHAQLRQDEEELTDSYYSETGNRQAVPVKRPSFTKVATAAQSYLPTASSTWRLNMSAHWKQHVTDSVLEYFWCSPNKAHSHLSWRRRANIMGDCDSGKHASCLFIPIQLISDAWVQHAAVSDRDKQTLTLPSELFIISIYWPHFLLTVYKVNVWSSSLQKPKLNQLSTN